MSEEWSWGVQKFTEEEQRAYDQKVGAVTGGNYEQPDNGYYSGEMGDEPARNEPQAPIDNGRPGAEEALQGIMNNEPAPTTEPEPVQNHWLSDPNHFAEVWANFEADPNYQDEHYTREQMDTLYDYYSSQNHGAPIEQWQSLPADDPFVTQEMQKNNWYDPVVEEQAAQAAQANRDPMLDIYNPTDPEQQKWLKERPLGDWDQLPWQGKLSVALSTNSPDLPNAPGGLKYTQAASRAMSSAGAGAATMATAGSILGTLGASGAAAALANPWVLLGASVAVGGLTFYQAVSGKELPVVNKFLELNDLKDTLTEKAVGFGMQTMDIAQGNIQRAMEDRNDAYGLLNALEDTFQQVRNDASAMWRANEYYWDINGDLGDFAIDLLNEITGNEGTKRGEGWFYNRGLSEKQQLEEGTYGVEASHNLTKMIKDMDALGIEKDLQDIYLQDIVSRALGTSGFVSDYTMQMLADLDAVNTVVQNEAMGTVSRIGNSQIGIEATKANRGNMLTQLPFVGNIIQAVGNTIDPGSMKSPGGFMEWQDRFREIARTRDVSQLTKAEKVLAGIGDDGRIKAFMKNDHPGMADMLAESKVAGVGNIANEVMDVYLYDAQDTADIRNRLASMVGDADVSTEHQTGMNNSAEVLTVRDGLRHAINETNPEAVLAQFDASAGARATLAKAAEDMGMEIKDVLSLYSETPAVFEQRVRDIAAKNNGMFAGIDVSNGVDPVSTIIKGFTPAKEGKAPQLDWNIKQVQYRITTSMIDSMAKYYTDYYGVKPNSTINTVFDTMKSAQSLLLLGWSPGYFINNVINNYVTSAAEGVMGFMTGKQISQYMAEFGVKPARMGIDTNAEFRGQDSRNKGKAEGLEAFTRAASDAKKQNDSAINKGLKSINEVLRNANDKLGVFSTLSGLMETLQGNQLTAVAIQQYWGRRWQRGEGFHLMPTSLVDAIEAQSPGLTNVIYQAVENGLSMDKIMGNLFDTYYVQPDAVTVMKSVCDDLFRGEASVYGEVFEKSGIMNDIREKFQNCKTDEERKTVIDNAGKKLNDYLDNLRREDLITRANATAATVESEGLAPVSQMMSEFEMNHQDFWLRIRQEENDIMVATQKMDSRESKALKEDLFARHRKEFADLYKQEAVTVAGIMKGLGFQNEHHVRYIGFMTENNQNWVNFFEEKNKELKRAYDRTDAIKEAGGKKYDKVKVDEVWDEYHRIASDLYKEHFAKEMELSRKRDDAFIAGYEFATGKSGDEFRKNFDRIRDIRQQMYEMQQDAHSRTRDMTPEDKNKFYTEEFNPKYNALIREIGNLGDANAQIINDAGTAGPGYENHADVRMTPDQTVTATETMEVSNRIREQAMRERQGYLDRDGIRQGWIDGGRTEAEADLMMAVFDAAADSWAKMNGAYADEFYSQAAQLKGIASWQREAAKDNKILSQSVSDFAAQYQTEIQNYIDQMSDADIKREQLKIINDTNPMQDDYHVGIRTVEDIHTFAEAVDIDARNDELDVYPDWNQTQMQTAIDSGKITVYSSYPIENGGFVTPSKMMAQDYAGGGKIYSAEVDINSVAWINSSEGQYAKVSVNDIAPKLHQDVQTIAKGTFEHSDIGNIIRMLEASDVSTMVHESGHLFRRTLSTPLLTEFTQWAGFENVGEFQELEAKYWQNDPTLTTEQKARYEEAEEKFARGFEQYLADGSAPTPGLKAVFKAMRDYLLDIYQKVKATVTGNDYSGQGEFQFNGETLNINAEINGIKLRDIFDRMLTDDTQRTPGYTELIRQAREDLSQNRKYMRLDPEALTKKAQYQVTDKIMKYFGSLDQAESALSHYTQPFTIDGMIVDDAVLHETIQAVKSDSVSDTPHLNQSVLEDDGKWSSEFAKLVDEEKQNAFDNGLNIPLDQAESVYLRGDVDTEYETMVQRWLRDFSNQKNLSADQYLYAWDFFEWWVKGSEGEAPQGNLAWEAKVQKMVLDDFNNGEAAEIVKELKRRYEPGTTVDNIPVPDKGEFFKRTYHFEHGYWDIAGNVYKDGKLVAYLPEQISQMQKTITVDGETYKVLGIDTKNPDGLVYYDPILEITRTVIAGKPEGFDEPRNPFAFIKPAQQGSTPQPMPVADAYSELSNKYLMPALNAFMDKFREADTEARTKKLSGLDLQTRAELVKWLDQDVREDMRQEKYRAMKYSDSKKDAAMLNYNQRYGFDPMLTMLSPYQFWYTRSMWKWAKRMIDKPALGNAYERLKEYEDKNRQENLPSRMAGKWRIPMPFLPDWMGGSYFIDLNAQLFPFSQFGKGYGSDMNQATLNARTEEILSEMVDMQQITAQDREDAIKNKSGQVWENAFAQAEAEIGKNDQLNTLASQFISPNIFWSWYTKKMAGEDPGMLGSTRTGNAIRALTQDIPLISTIGDKVGDAMSMPEKALRKLYGFDFNEFGAYGDQQIRKQISQMCADGDITWTQALNAMNEKSGTIWDMAADRQRKEAMIKVPGFTAAEAVKQFAMGNASLGEALGGLAMGLLGGGTILPEGEKTLREMKALRDDAYTRQAAGEKDAVSKWYDEYGDIYTTRTATYMSDPEELLKYTLYQNINQKYYDQPYAQQWEIKKALGPEFEWALFNPETKNYKAVPVEKLAEWNARMGGQNPAVGSVDVKGVERVMQLSQPVIDSVDTYYAEKERLFPGIGVIQDGYSSLPKDQKKAYLEAFPQLKNYWEWNDRYKKEHQELVQWMDNRSEYYKEQTCYESYAAMSQNLMKELEYTKATKNPLSNAAQYELQKLHDKYGSFYSLEEYQKMLQDWK